MDISLMTYNTLFNNALKGLPEIIKKTKPEIICLQEIELDQESFGLIERLGYKLADYSANSIKFGRLFGLATFYNPTHLYFKTSKIIHLNKTILDWIFSLPNLINAFKTNRNFLKTEFYFIPAKKIITVYNTHLSVYGSNQQRIKQIKTLLQSIKNKDKIKSVIIAGDFNFLPYGRKKLEKLMSETGFKEATYRIDFTIQYRNLKKFRYSLFEQFITKIFSFFYRDRLKIDYVFYKNLDLVNCRRLDFDWSDHYPIITRFKI